jgi:hypothetical protein
MDNAGNLYGTTAGGGKAHSGIVFELRQVRGGSWEEAVLHDFGFKSGYYDGLTPQTGLVLDAAGNLYGTTSAGGTGGCTNNANVVIGCGTVFELSPQVGGAWWDWTEKILYNFSEPAGAFGGTALPSPLILDSAGNLYGTVQLFGKHGHVVAFKLSPSGAACHVKALYDFGLNGPASGLTASENAHS